MGLLEAVDDAIRAADWLNEKADAGTIALARTYAAHVDDALDDGDPELIRKAISVAGPNLQKTLHSLGLNPESRGELGAKDDGAAKNPFDELKKRRVRAEKAAVKKAVK